MGLEAALRARLDDGPVSFTLVVPLGRTPESHRVAERMGMRLSIAGLDVRGCAGDADPLHAVLETWSSDRFDEIVVSTLPRDSSAWLRTDLLRRIERHTGALVRHVEAHEAVASPLSTQFAAGAV